MEKKFVSATVGRTAGPASQLEVNAELLDVRAVATLLGCSVRHVHRLNDTGRMPSKVKLGACTRWRRTEIIEWIKNGCPLCKGGNEECLN